MSNHYSDPTANAAIGAVDKEIRAMQKKAAHLKKLRKAGRLTPAMAAQARKEFTGIHRRLLQEALGE